MAANDLFGVLATDDIAVSCRNLSRSFGAIQAVASFDLTVHEGEILALVGPSGCGKTTVLRLIAGFETPSTGQVEIGGRVVAGPGVWLPPEQRRVGMVFQDYALFPHLSVAENVAYGLPKGHGRRQRVEQVLALVGLSGLETRSPHALSGGQQQRVALARALAPRPEILLLDEPFSNLDAAQRVTLREETREILKQGGVTGIFVTHDQKEALFMGDRLAVLHQGRLLQIGRPEEIFFQPATRFVARFMGETDFVSAEITPDGICTEIGWLPQRVSLPAGTPVDVALRADDVALKPDPQGEAQVIARRFEGMAHVYRVRLPSGGVVHSLQPHTVVYELGTRVRVRIEPGHPLAWFPSHAAVSLETSHASPSAGPPTNRRPAPAEG